MCAAGAVYCSDLRHVQLLQHDANHCSGHRDELRHAELQAAALARENLQRVGQKQYFPDGRLLPVQRQRIVVEDQRGEGVVARRCTRHGHDGRVARAQ